MTATRFLFKPGQGVDVVIRAFSETAVMACLKLKPIHLMVVELNPFLFQDKNISIAKVENAGGPMKTKTSLRMLKPEFEIKVLVIDSNTVIEGFSDKELLQRGKVGDIMGMKQYLSVMRGWDG